MAAGPTRLFQTGIAGLDTLLGGGIPARQMLTVTGTPGTGKTVLCGQIAFLAAARGISVAIGSVTAQAHDKLVDEMSGFTFFREELLGEQVFLFSTYSALQKGIKEARDLILRTVRDRKAKLLFIDDLRAVRDLWQDEAKLREFFYELGIGLSVAGCIGIFTTSYPVDRLLTLPEATSTDAIVSLAMRPQGLRQLRRAEVVKVRGAAHLTGGHLLEIGKEGIRIIPRLEALPIVGDLHGAADEGRTAFGLPELDRLMGGGPPAGSSTMLAGSLGIGKTLLSTLFALEGARKGEKALFISFSEGLGALAARARRIGVDVQSSIADGTLQLIYLPPGELEADVVIDQILSEIARTGARRLIIDGLGILELSIAEADRRHVLLGALSLRLRLAGVTTVFTRQVAKVVGAELDFSDTPIAILCENLVLLRYVELRGHIHRILSVLKMRDSGYQSDVREFQISDQGIGVLAPLRSVQGLLTGQAHPLGSTTAGETS